MVQYFHVTNTELNLDTPNASPSRRTTWRGKPVGLWYAPGTAWIDREEKIENRSYTYKYEFPLKEENFTEDINSPAISKIFRLTAKNIGTFEEKFTSYLAENLRTVKAKLYLIPLSRLDDFRTDEEKQNRVQGKKYDQLLLEDITNFKKGLPVKHPKISIAIRLIEYGKFFNTLMEPVWGGIDFDASLFTEELKAMYPFIEQVEIPSGCLWHPKEVMPGYIPRPVQGGKRTRRNKLRKSTRRRRQ